MPRAFYFIYAECFLFYFISKVQTERKKWQGKVTKYMWRNDINQLLKNIHNFMLRKLFQGSRIFTQGDRALGKFSFTLQMFGQYSLNKRK